MTAFMKHVPLMVICLIGSTYVSSFAENADGNDSGGGLGEIGFRRSDAHSPWSLEGRLRGYVGEREGVSGMMSATWRF